MHERVEAGEGIMQVTCHAEHAFSYISFLLSAITRYYLNSGGGWVHTALPCIILQQRSSKMI